MIGTHIHLGTLGREGVNLRQGLWGGDIGQGVSGTGALIRLGVSGMGHSGGCFWEVGSSGAGALGFFFVGFSSGHLV